MFSLLLEKEPSVEDIPEEEEEVEEEEKGPDEQTLLINDEIMECFEIFDKNKTGTLEEHHLKKALESLGIFLTDFEIEELKESLNQNGSIPFQSFYKYAFDVMMNSDPYEALKIAFRGFDPDKEGFLPSDRVKRWLTTLGEPLTEKEAKELIKMGDPAGKGFIAYNDLTMILLKK